MESSGLDMTVYEGRRGWPELYESWQQLLRSVEHQCFYQHPDWFDAFLDRSDEDTTEILFFAIRRDDALIAVIPIELKTKGTYFKFNEAALPLREQLYMPDCAIADKEDKLEILSFFLCRMQASCGKNWDVFTVPDTLANSCIAREILRLKGRHPVTRFVRNCSEIFVTPYPDAQQRMKRKFRQNLRRSYRKIEKLNDVIFLIENSERGVKKAFSQFVELEASGWKSGKGKLRGEFKKPFAISLDRNKMDFYRNVINSFSIRNCIDVFSIRIGEKLISMQICIVLNKTCYVLKTAYDENFSSYSPGHLIQDFAYRHYAQRGDVGVINLISDSPADDGWLPKKTAYLTIRCFNTTIKGRLMSIALPFIYAIRDRTGGDNRSRRH